MVTRLVNTLHRRHYEWLPLLFFISPTCIVLATYHSRCFSGYNFQALVTNSAPCRGCRSFFFKNTRSGGLEGFPVETPLRTPPDFTQLFPVEHGATFTAQVTGLRCLVVRGSLGRESARYSARLSSAVAPKTSL